MLMGISNISIKTSQLSKAFGELQEVGPGLATGVILAMAPILVTTLDGIMVGLGIRKLSRPVF